jgi:hypothetical protein
VFLLDTRSFRDHTLRENVAEASFDPARTLLGQAQLDALQADLLRAQADGVRWKFIFTPTPIQQFGALYAEERWEGFAAERSALLRFIRENGIANVVFIAAGMHGLIVNEVFDVPAYSAAPVPVGAVEVAVPAAGVDKPLGIDLLQRFAPDAPPLLANDMTILLLFNGQLALSGVDPIGLATPRAELIRGGYFAAFLLGWTEFEIDATGALTVTTYGVDPYTAEDAQADPAGVAARAPQVISQFRVTPEWN